MPFPVESALSGIMRNVTENDRLWYRRTFELPAEWRQERVLPHFGAVDFEALVWLNGHQLGQHRGGYNPFHFDITDALRPSGHRTTRFSMTCGLPCGRVARPPTPWTASQTGACL